MPSHPCEGCITNGICIDTKKGLSILWFCVIFGWGLSGGTVGHFLSVLDLNP